MGAEGEPTGEESTGGSEDNTRLLEVQQLVDDRGRVAAAEALGVNYRTVVANLEAGRLSRRMRTAVQQFEKAEPEPAGSSEPEEAGQSADQAETVEQGMEALLGEVHQLRETVEEQADQLQELGRRVAEPKAGPAFGENTPRNGDHPRGPIGCRTQA